MSFKSALMSAIGVKRARRVRTPAFWGTVRRAAPLTTDEGYHRGTPIDRIYMEGWVDAQRARIRGSVLEVKDSDLVTRFGADLDHVDVVDIDADNPQATIVADIAQPDALPTEAYDCAVVTQVLQYVTSPLDAVRNLIGSLKPGGTLLLTVPGVEPCEHGSLAVDRWRFLTAGVEQIIETATQGGSFDTEVTSFGNAATVLGYCAGASAEDGFSRYFDDHDPHYPLIIAARVTKAS